MTFTLVPITGTYRNEDGSIPRGSVSFTRSKTLQDSSTDRTASNSTLTARLDEAGHIAVSLIANDDPTSQPTGTTYLVVESIGTSKRRYRITVPHASGGLDLADVAPVVQGPQVFSYALQSALADEITARTAADNALQSNITSEATARGNADTSEATTRAAADTALSGSLAAHNHTLLGLSDTPDAYTGQALKALRVKSTEDGVEFGTVSGGGGASLSDNNPAALGSVAPGWVRSPLVTTTYTLRRG
jgi:hypothetical protein